MIRVEPISQDQWLVTVSGATTTTHRVSVSAAEIKRLGRDSYSVEEVLQASFRFLLDREANTSILPAFDLMVIARYFPEYESEIGRYLAK